MGAVERWLAAWGAAGRQAAPRAGLAARVALVVALNQPFYPLYFYWAVSPVFLPSCATFLSTPFFAAVPATLRRSTLLGRALLLGAGLGNVLICRVVFGSASGVDVFLLPCLVLAALLFWPTERVVAVAFSAAAFAVYLSPDAALRAPLHPYDEDAYAAMRRLNFLSAAGLTALIGFMAARIADAEPGDREIQARAARVDVAKTEGPGS